MMNKYDDGGGGEDNDEKDAVNHLVCRCELFWTGGCGELGNDTAGLYLVTMMIIAINKNLMITMMMMMVMVMVMVSPPLLRGRKSRKKRGRKRGGR